jgi:hypothetical protein
MCPHQFRTSGSSTTIEAPSDMSGVVRAHTRHAPVATYSNMRVDVMNMSWAPQAAGYLPVSSPADITLRFQNHASLNCDTSL